LYVGLLAFSFFLDFLQTYYMQWTGQKVMFDLRSQIFRHLQRLHVGFEIDEGSHPSCGLCDAAASPL
jgi:ABC-type bacteriocin/lantibiotic exporter with double-glycine peptidase domain